MARSRVIKPEFSSDEKLARLSRDARLTYILMWTCSDDYGVTKAHPAWLKSQIFPYDDVSLKKFQEWLSELEKLNRIVSFSVNSEKYYYIPGFKIHQKVDHPSKNRNPEPPPDILANDSRDFRDETETETETETKGDRERFSPPSIEEVGQYCRERGNEVVARTWWDHYQAKGWMIGKNKMKDWKAAVRTWEKDKSQQKRPDDYFATMEKTA